MACLHSEEDSLGWICRKYDQFAIGVNAAQWVCDAIRVRMNIRQIIANRSKENGS